MDRSREKTDTLDLSYPPPPYIYPIEMRATEKIVKAIRVIHSFWFGKLPDKRDESQ